MNEPLPQLPARIVRHGRLAAGNALGRRPCDAFVLGVPPGTRVDRAAVARLLSSLPPEFAEAFAAVALPPAADPAAGAFAALWAAANACGRPLAMAIEATGTTPGEWLVLVEEGEAARPPRDVPRELLVHLSSAVPPPVSPATRAWLAGHAQALARSTWSVLRRALTARDVGWRAGPMGKGLRVGAGIGRRDARGLVTGDTGWLAATWSEDKARCGTLLRRFGLPAARQELATTRSEAVASAGRLGFPVVVKPIGASGGNGVSVGVTMPEEVGPAFVRAAAVSRPVVVETLLPGDDHRFLVIAGAVVSVVRKEAASVQGDGVRSLAELRMAVDADPRRRGADATLMPLRCDAETEALLARAGLSWDSVPAAGRRVPLQGVANWDRGGTTREVAAVAHPDNRRAALQAARLLGLDVAGIDFLLPDIRRSWRETGGGICEVNRSPGGLIHLAADGGSDAAIEAFVGHWLGGRPPVPVLLAVGEAGADRVAEGMAARLAALGVPTGLATGTVLIAAGLPLRDPGPQDPTRIARLVDDPAVAAVVMAVPAEILDRRGLGHGRVDMAILVEGEPATQRRAEAVLARLGAAVTALPATERERFLQMAADRLADLARRAQEGARRP
ncbi:hypothetical protein STAQ_37050 [Allostella sp. ATCC 35155]|nr:hypothetical protein STAQ_37050 [Stella sp. ATCC 35155]